MGKDFGQSSRLAEIHGRSHISRNSVIFLGVKNTFLFTREGSYARQASSHSSGKCQAHCKMFLVEAEHRVNLSTLLCGMSLARSQHSSSRTDQQYIDRTLLAEFQKPQQPLNCKRQDFIVRFEIKLKNKVPVKSLDKKKCSKTNQKNIR